MANHPLIAEYRDVDKMPLVERHRLVEDTSHYEKEFDTVPRWFRCFLQPCVAELLGTTIFVFIGCLSLYDDSLVTVALAHGFTIVILVSSFGTISGGHFNPVVTLGSALAGRTPPLLAFAYFFCQMGGGLMGAGIAKGVLTGEMYQKIGGGAQDIGVGVGIGQAIVCEMVLTSLLVLTVLMTTIDSDQNRVAPIAIGFSVTCSILAGGLVSGASMNPARSFGPAVAITTSTTKYWQHHYVYWAGPVLGSLMSSLVYRFILANDEKRLVFN